MVFGEGGNQWSSVTDTERITLTVPNKSQFEEEEVVGGGVGVCYTRRHRGGGEKQHPGVTLPADLGLVKRLIAKVD